MGVVPIPEKWTVEKIEESYILSAQAGEYVSMSEKLDWDSITYIDTYKSSMTEARSHGLRIMYSMDILDDPREEIAQLPVSLSGKNFSDPKLRTSFKNEAFQVAEQLRPEYLMLGLELNGYYITHPGDFHNFVTLYIETYDSIKAVFPDMRISVTFQYETMKFRNQWHTLLLFQNKLDVLAFTTYPGLIYDSLSLLPENYYQAIADSAESIPVVFTEIGWKGNKTTQGEQEQANFITSFIEATDSLNLRMLIYCLLHDWPGGGHFETMGLIDTTGRKKPIWYLWKEIKDLPITAIRFHPYQIFSKPTILSAVFPNPVNSTAYIKYMLQQEAVVSINILTIKGNLIRVLLNNKKQCPGIHRISWDGTDNKGKSLSNGGYFYQIRTDKKATINKITVIR